MSALVRGAASGIGRATCLRLARDGRDRGQAAEGLDLADRSVRALDQSRLGLILTGDPEALRYGPPVTAMLVQNTNPAMVCPDLTLVHKGLAREDLFLCVHEQFLTETAAFADVVLPATTFLEHDDCYTASGHTTFQVARKVIDPPAECRENHAVISELARRLGASHPGFTMTAGEIVDRTLRQSGMWDAQTNWERGGQDMALPFERAHLRVVLGNERGAVIVHARPRAGQARGVVVVEGILARPRLRGRSRHQRPHQRRARLPERRRGLP